MPKKKQKPGAYIVDHQIGFLLRKAMQRHAAIFFSHDMGGLTQTQWAILAKLAELEACSQNQLGRLVAMDAATTKGVIDRLIARGLVTAEPDATHARRIILRVSEAGLAIFKRLASTGATITEETISPLTEAERDMLHALLERLT